MNVEIFYILWENQTQCRKKMTCCVEVNLNETVLFKSIQFFYSVDLPF